MSKYSFSSPVRPLIRPLIWPFTQLLLRIFNHRYVLFKGSVRRRCPIAIWTNIQRSITSLQYDVANTTLNAWFTAHTKATGHVVAHVQYYGTTISEKAARIMEMSDLSTAGPLYQTVDPENWCFPQNPVIDLGPLRLLGVLEIHLRGD